MRSIEVIEYVAEKLGTDNADKIFAFLNGVGLMTIIEEMRKKKLL